MAIVSMTDQDGICDELEMIIAEEVEEELQAAVDEASEYLSRY